MPSWKLVNAELAAWCAEECGRIERGESSPYHAVLCDPPYGISFMSKEWDGFGAFRRAENEADAGRKDVFGRTSRTSPEYLAGIGFQEQVCIWGEALKPLLYPGALVFMFAGTRMWHRLAAGMEDAGFQMWDTLLWLHGQGFPKAQAIDALIDKARGDERTVVVGNVERWGNGTGKGRGGQYANDYEPTVPGIRRTDAVLAPATELSAPWAGHKTAALKPAWEPVLCFRAPDGGRTYADLALAHGSGALNVDKGRIGVSKRIPFSTSAAQNGSAWNKPEARPSDDGQNPNLGRYPANLALECTCENVQVEVEVSSSHPQGSCYGEYGPADYRRAAGKIIRHTDPNCPAAMLDAQAGESRSSGIFSPHGDGRTVGGVATDFGGRNVPASMFSDSGGPSRFFYCAKASRGEREAGLEEFDPQARRPAGNEWGTTSLWNGENGDLEWRAKNPNNPVRNAHPTVKPIDLNRWLASLLLPPASVSPRRILVPFAGSGSEMCGALLAGWDEITGIEREADYCRIADARLVYWAAQAGAPEVRGESEISGTKETRIVVPAQPSLFG